MKTRITQTDKIVFAIIALLGLAWVSLFIMGYNQDPNTTERNTVGYYHNMGDAIGGISAPLIGLISALLVYITIKQQIRANEIIMETRKEDNMAVYLKDNIERMEAKYAQVAQRCSEFKGLNTPLGVVNGYEENLKMIESKGKYGGDPRYPMPHVEKPRVNSAFISIEEKRPVLDGILGLLKFCTAYHKYLFTNYTDISVSGEMKNIIEIYISEYTAFIGMNLRSTIVKIESLRPYITIEDDFNKDLSELVNHAKIVNSSTGHLDAVVDFSDH